MEYYVKYYDVLYDKENFKEDIVLKDTDTYIITDDENVENSYTKLQVIDTLLYIIDDGIEKIECFDDIKNVTDFNKWYMFSKYTNDLKTEYHFLEIRRGSFCGIIETIIII